MPRTVPCVPDLSRRTAWLRRAWRLLHVRRASDLRSVTINIELACRRLKLRRGGVHQAAESFSGPRAGCSFKTGARPHTVQNPTLHEHLLALEPGYLHRALNKRQTQRCAPSDSICWAQGRLGSDTTAIPPTSPSGCVVLPGPDGLCTIFPAYTRAP